MQTLSHVMLLEPLSNMGAHDIELSWFIDYLSQHVKRIKVRDKVSSCMVSRKRCCSLGKYPGSITVYVNAMPSLVIRETVTVC